jgi:hypothetical protein
MVLNGSWCGQSLVERPATGGRGARQPMARRERTESQAALSTSGAGLGGSRDPDGVGRAVAMWLVISWKVATTAVCDSHCPATRRSCLTEHAWRWSGGQPFPPPGKKSSVGVENRGGQCGAPGAERGRTTLRATAAPAGWPWWEVAKRAWGAGLAGFGAPGGGSVCRVLRILVRFRRSASPTAPVAAALAHDRPGPPPLRGGRPGSRRGGGSILLNSARMKLCDVATSCSTRVSTRSAHWPLAAMP